MFKPHQIAPFFQMQPYAFTRQLRDLHQIYPLPQTPKGSFLIRSDDIDVIETYLQTRLLFNNKEQALHHMAQYLQEREEPEPPEWLTWIKDDAGRKK